MIARAYRSIFTVESSQDVPVTGHMTSHMTTPTLVYRVHGTIFNLQKMITGYVQIQRTDTPKQDGGSLGGVKTPDDLCDRSNSSCFTDKSLQIHATPTITTLLLSRPKFSKVIVHMARVAV